MPEWGYSPFSTLPPTSLPRSLPRPAVQMRAVQTPQPWEIVMFKKSLVASALAACAFTSIAQANDPAVIREWNVLAEGVIPTSAGPSLPRTYAMMHIAMFDAVNSIEGGYKSYRVNVPATRIAS